jgi:hypothetical protein
MKVRRLFAFLLGLAGFTLFAGPSWAEPAVPKETPLFVTPTDENDRATQHLYPLGWSADGKFAWLTRNIEEETEDGMWTLTVMDAVSNQRLEKQEITFQYRPGEGLEKFWRKQGKTILATLAKHAVKAGPTVMDHFPLALGPKLRYRVGVSLAVTAGSSEQVENAVKSCELSVNLNGTATVIWKQSYEADLPYLVSVAGCFHSPDEKFGVVVVTMLKRGWHGGPHMRSMAGMAGFQMNAE